MSAPGERVLTPSSLAQMLDRLVQRHWPDVAVQGEVSSVTVPASGHCYLSLRDPKATLGCVMWRGEFRRSAFKPKRGDKIVAVGRMGIYPGQSKYQLYIRAMRPAGEGDRAKELAAIKARLEADGLLDPRRKRALPDWPRVIGVCTSGTGAAVQDFIEVSGQRWPSARVLISPCLVQGPESPSSVIRALDLLIEDGRSDVIVVTRGGGSREDLAAFDDEQLARAIAHSPIPVVTAVGHQTDTGIVDLVSDAVAPTPSAAAMLVTPDGPAWIQRIDEAETTLHSLILGSIGRLLERVHHLRARLRSPTDRLAAARQQLDASQAALQRSVQAHLDQRRAQLDMASARLKALSPFGVLDRGYAIVRTSTGVLRDPAEVQPGERLEIRVAGGEVSAAVLAGGEGSVDG